MRMQFLSMRRIFTAGVALVLFASALSAQVSQKAQAVAVPVPLLSGSIDETRLLRLPGSMRPEAKAQQSAEVAPDDFKLDRMILQLKRSKAQEAALKRLLDDQQNPNSPQYHRWLSPSEFGERFGAAPEDIQVIANWLQSRGFTVDSVAKARNLIVFSGTQDQLRRAFHTEMRRYLIQNERHWANASDVQIPVALAPVVSGIVSLNDVPLRGNHTDPVLVQKDSSSRIWSRVGKWTPPASSASGSKVAPQLTIPYGNDQIYLLAPYDFAKVYNLEPLWNAGLDGTGQTIVIVARSNVNPADIDVFRAQFGLPEKKLNVILPTGVDPGTGDVSGRYGDEGETDLDVQWAGAVAKGATIDLVATPITNVTDGVVLSAIYAIQENLAPIMSVSYGMCEFDLQGSGNQFYNELWKQAAAQGITVIVSSGDYGPATCDARFDTNVALSGSTVNGLASTPYNVAVGGTDFKTFNTTPGQFWTPTNDPATKASAQSYIPESPWNNSCQNQEILAWLNAKGASYLDNAALCTLGPVDYHNFVGGGGGASNCIDGTDPYSNSSCTKGYPKPSWQDNIPGGLADNARDLPDVSLFAASGAFNSLLPYCQSDVFATGYTCSNSLQGAGGTSFAAPAFAGIMAIINQKMQSPQGVANYSLYKLATKQFSDSTQAECTTSTVAPGNGCYFYDVAEGSIDVPCARGSKECVNGALGWDAGVGYDLATGVGTINAYNLVNAWPSAAGNLLPSQTDLTVASTTAYGAPLSAAISVTPAPPGAGTPMGPVVVRVDGEAYSLAAELSQGTASITLPAIAVGSHLVTAAYGGDAIFGESDSAAATLVVYKASPTITLSATRATVSAGQTVTLSNKFEVLTNGNLPTGTVTFSDRTTNAVLGAGDVASVIDPISGRSITTATLTVPASALNNGANAINATYSGDESYNPVTSESVTITYSARFSIAVTPASLQISAGSATTGSVTVNVTPAAGVTLKASDFTFACSGTLAPGVGCSFSPATVSPSGVVSSTLTVNVNPAQIPSPMRSTEHSGRLEMIAIAFGGLGGLLLTCQFGKSGKHRTQLTLLLAVMTFVSGVLGCGGSSHSAVSTIKSGPESTTTTLRASSLTPAFGSAVTLDASVASAAGTVPTGQVTFMDGNTALGAVTLVNGSASFNANALPLGMHSVTARYSGDTKNAPSVSAGTNIDVTYSTNLTVTVRSSDGSESVGLPVTVH